MGRANCITDKQVVQRVQVAVKLELEKNIALGVPIVVYDRERKIIIVKNSDGIEIEVANRLRKGRYSERVKEFNSTRN